MLKSARAATMEAAEAVGWTMICAAALLAGIGTRRPKGEEVHAMSAIWLCNFELRIEAATFGLPGLLLL